ncbi:MAG: flagellar basal body rod protein FlgB [Thermoguttaceae bacterium]|jgi:flagellar basal-body rod protein FlgB
MISNLFDSTTIPVLQEVVNFCQARHTVLAGNIANMDTPGYKVRDLSVEDFQSRLHEAIEERHQPPSSSQEVSPGEIGLCNAEPLAEVAKNSKTILHHDQNNVGIEHQVTEMVKNQMQHNIALTIMVKQFHMLETAISEKV